MVRKDSESSESSVLDCCQIRERESPANDAVVNKYQMGAEITNAVLKGVIAAVKEGVEVGTLCDLGDKMILERTAKIFKKEKDVQKGIAMPTCVSVDNCICHFSPLRSDPPVVLKNGQMVKIDLGVNVDGYVATAAHTIVVGASKDNKVTEKKADVIKAAYDAMEIAIRMLRPGNKNMDITTAIDQVASEYGVSAVENMVSHQLDRFQIDGERQIIQNPGEKERAELEKFTIDKNEVYAIDVLFSTGKGKAKDMDVRSTVFKKTLDTQYSLKMKASRIFFSECNSKHGTMPFTLRSFEDEVKAKMGVVECEKHGLVRAFPVRYENKGEFVAQFKATVLVMPNGLIKITGLPLDTDCLEPSAKLQDATLIQTLNSALKQKKKKAEPVKKEEPACKEVKPCCRRNQ